MCFIERLHLYHFAGVITVGIGDSMAAIVGSRYGRIHWFNSPKTAEGTLAFFTSHYISSCIFCALYACYCELHVINLLRLFAASFVCACLEAHLPVMDNIILPIVAYLLLF